MGVTSTAGSGASLGYSLGGAGGAATGAGVGAGIGAVTGYFDYRDAQKQAEYNRNLLDKKITALDSNFEASTRLLETKYNMKLSGIKSKKIDLNDEVMTELDSASVKANQELSTMMAISVGSGVTGNARARLQSAATQTAELNKTNTYMQGKRAEGQLTEAGFTAEAETRATQDYQATQYQNQRDILAYERNNIQDPDLLSFII